MDSSSFNLNTITENPLVRSKFLDPQYLFDNIIEFFRLLPQYLFRQETGDILNVIFLLLALFFLTLIAYCAVRLLEIRAKEHKHLQHEIAEYAEHQAQREKKLREGESVSENEHWRQVLQYLLSSNSNEWKLAVIEADSMLQALMDQLGFKGENLGDKLKTADRGNFRSLSLAWEVHTIRNRIAHEGSAFELSSHEAKRVIALYEQIFREFGYI